MTLAVIATLAKNSTARHTFLVRHDLDVKKAALAESEREVVKLDLESLWSLTQKRLDLYHDIATVRPRRAIGTAAGPSRAI